MGARVDGLVRDIVRMSPEEGGQRPRVGWPEEADRVARALTRVGDRFAELLRSESVERRRLESILDSMQQGVIVVNGDGVVESANPAALEMLGNSSQYSPGSQLASITRDARINALVVEAIDSGEPQQASVPLRDRNRLVNVLTAPLPSSDRSSGRVLALINDVTDSALADNTRREFVSNASHELRTPIAAIQAAAETLQGGAMEDPEAARDFLRRILEDTARMEALVSEMLELSRLESGQTPLHLGPVDTGLLVDEMLDRFRPVADQKGVTLEGRVCRGIPMVIADRSRLETALGNLLRNSLQATESGDWITVGANGVDGSVRLAVSDTGAGIFSEHLPHVFERFYKAGPSRGQSGTGLGLAISKHIVQAHGGSISAESSPGEGTTIAFILPAVPGAG